MSEHKSIQMGDFDLSYEPERATNPAYFHLTTHGDNQAAIDPVDALALAGWIQKVMTDG